MSPIDHETQEQAIALMNYLIGYIGDDAEDAVKIVSHLFKLPESTVLAVWDNGDIKDNQLGQEF